MPHPAPRSILSSARHLGPSLPLHFALASASAILLALSFPAPGLWPLAHLALVPLIILALRATRPWRLAWTTWLVSFIWWLIMIRWMYPVTVGGTIGLSAYMAIYWPLFALIVRFLHRRYRRAAMVLTVPAVWVSLEVMRCQWLQGGFAWFALGHSQMSLTPDPTSPGFPGVNGRLVQVADLAGQYGVSFLVAMTNGLLADLIERLRSRYRDEPATPALRTLEAAAAVWLAAFAAALIYGHYRLGYDLSAAPRLDIAVIQTNVPQSNKDNPTQAQMDRDWQRLLDLTAQATDAQPAPALVVWPETMVPRALNPEALDYYRSAQTSERGSETFDQQIRTLAAQRHLTLLVGADANFDWRQIPAGGDRFYVVPMQRHNSVYLYHPDGLQDPQRYDKIHLVPFGEFIPWVNDWPPLKALFLRYLSPYDFDYTIKPGHQYTVFTGPPAALPPPAATSPATAPTPPPATAAWPGSPEPRGLTPAPPSAATPSTPPVPHVRIATPICFEDAYPDILNRMCYTPEGRKRADLIANLTNDGWFLYHYDPPWLHQWYGLPVGWLVSWFGTSYQAEQELQSAAFRCVENRVPMVRSVNTGISGFIDSSGRIGPLVTVDGHHKEVDGFARHTVTLDPRDTFFGLAGQAPVIILQVLTALWLLGGAFRAGKMVAHERSATTTG